jgi:hypothetical protein
LSQEADKVYYIQYIKSLPVREARMAEMAVLSGHYQDAENMLLQVGPWCSTLQAFRVSPSK